MVNTALLKAEIERSGYRIKKIAEWAGINVKVLYLKIANKRNFKIGEVEAICRILNITSYERINAIFFANEIDILPQKECKQLSCKKLECVLPPELMNICSYHLNVVGMEASEYLLKLIIDDLNKHQPKMMAKIKTSAPTVES